MATDGEVCRDRILNCTDGGLLSLLRWIPVWLLFLTVCADPSLAVALDYSKYESGKIWCNDRYLSPEDVPLDNIHLQVAKRGYLYVLAAALELQRVEEEDHYFGAPARLEMVNRVGPEKSGFEAATFKVHPAKGDEAVSEIVVAFAGSNQAIDWFKTDFGWDNAQYTQARDYVLTEAKKYPGVRMVTSGFSLGGALAVHVGKDARTKDKIAEVWALNPSPRIKVDRDEDERIWLASMRKDALKWARDMASRKSSGKGAIGAYPEHAAEKYYFVKSLHSYAHFRWVLMRNILFAADLAMLDPAHPDASTEPLEILKLSRFKACTNPAVDAEPTDQVGRAE
jgi:hypothetical protein